MDIDIRFLPCGVGGECDVSVSMVTVYKAHVLIHCLVHVKATS